MAASASRAAPRLWWRGAGRGRPLLAFLPFLLLITIVLGAPLWMLVQLAFADGLTHWGSFLDDQFALDAVARTLLIAGQTTIICAVLGYLYVGALLQSRGKWRALLLVAAVLPFLTSILVRTYGWIVILGNDGPVTSVYRDISGSTEQNPFLFNRVGLLIGMVHVMLPLFVLPLFAVMSQIPDNLRRAARTLGANAVESYLRVDVRLSLPGAAAGALLVFVTSLGFFITPALLGGPGDMMVSQVIDQMLRQSIDLNGAAVLGVVLLVAVFGCILAFRAIYPLELLFVQSATRVQPQRGRRLARLVGRMRVGSPGRGLNIRLAITRALSRIPWGVIATVSGAAIAVYFVAPLLVVVPVSFSGQRFLTFPPDGLSLQWYDAILSDPTWRDAGIQSLLVGLCATFIAFVVGLPLAFAVVRSSVARGLKGAVVFLAALPVIFPIVVLALAVYVWYLELRVVGQLVPLAAAHALLGLPFLLVIVMASLQDFDIRLERAARSLGASQWRTLWRVTLPIIRRGIAAGLLFAFLHSFDELLIARNVTDVDTITLPVKIWNGANEEVSPALGAVSVLFIAFAVLALGVYTGLQRARERGQQ